MKKKFLIVFAFMLLGLVLVSCGGRTYEIAMITDTGDIDDGSFNQGTWEGIVKYAKEHNISHKYYKPNGETTADYITAIDLAVSRGAKIVITPGFYFEVPIFDVQDKYPDVKFVLLDGKPNNADYDGDYQEKIGDNSLAVFFQEEQAGFLAAYATYKEGFDQLGFMGGIAVPAVIRFGIGWVAGAYLAASEAEDADFEFQTQYYEYLNSFGPSDAFKTKAAAWFQELDVIHAAAGGAGFSVMAAAEDATGKWVVGVDSDQANDSDTVLTSAFKGVGAAAYIALEQFYKDEFPGGEEWNLGVNDEAVDIPMETSRFENFKDADHAAIYAKLVSGEVVVPTTTAELEAFLTALGYTMPEGLAAKIND